MKYLEEIEAGANFCIGVYDSKSGMLVEEFMFVIDEDSPRDVPAALRYVCSNHGDCIDWKSTVKFFKMRDGHKIGAF